MNNVVLNGIEIYGKLMIGMDTMGYGTCLRAIWFYV